MDNFWHAYSDEDAVDKLKSNIETGLSNEEALKRSEGALNVLPTAKKDGFLMIALKQMADPIIIMLIIATVFSFLAKETLDAFAIILIVFLDVALGTFQEWKAGQQADKLSSMIKVMSKVMRDSKIIELDSQYLVPGDIVYLESGVKVSADMRILEAHNLQVDESLLTGESIAVVKIGDPLPENTLIADRNNMAYSGTSVVSGRGICVVTATGLTTEIGKLAESLAQTKETASPLTIKMRNLSKQLSLIVAFVAIIVAYVLFKKDYPFAEIFSAVVALSVSAIPEGLPLALTMTLSVSSSRMAKEKVIVKKIKSVEGLGSCTVIATDKTGTLTVNQQTAKKIVLSDGKSFEIEGSGYNDQGKVLAASHDLPLVEKIAILGMINNEAVMEKNQDKWESHGDSIDIAFLALAHKLSLDPNSMNALAEIPYESENKYSAAFYKENDENYCTVKGSLEKVISFCSTMGNGEKINKKILEEQEASLAREGYRIIAIANGKTENLVLKEHYDEKDIPKLNFEGLVAFIDPIRTDAKEAIIQCQEAGIKIAMITGDHPLTAFSIAKNLELIEDYEELVSGEVLDENLKKSEEEFDQFIKGKKVFARVSPLGKLAIIDSYKRQGEIVAVTGDGVNDAPAIKAANIGVSMGSGTDVAKETAKVILVDDSFKSLVLGIKEGRGAYSNIRKVCNLLLSTALAEVAFFIIALVLGMELPLLAIHLLWLNIITNGIQDLALAMEKVDDDIMKQKPISSKSSIFDKLLIEEIIVGGVVISIMIIVLWFYLLNHLGMEVFLARSYVLAFMVFIENFHVLNCRSEEKSVFKVPFKNNPYVIFSIVGSIILQFIIMEVPILARFLKISSLPFLDVFYLLVLSSVILFVMEIFKLSRKLRRKV